MKTPNILRILTLSILLVASTQKVFAADAITCSASNNKSFTFQIEAEPSQFESRTYPGTANNLHSMGVAIKSFPVEILVQPILTRTVVGFQYNFNLQNGTRVVLTNITFASTSFESQLGISGKAQLLSGTTVNLSCNNSQ